MILRIQTKDTVIQLEQEKETSKGNMEAVRQAFAFIDSTPLAFELPQEMRPADSHTDYLDALMGMVPKQVEVEAASDFDISDVPQSIDIEEAPKPEQAARLVDKLGQALIEMGVEDERVLESLQDIAQESGVRRVLELMEQAALGQVFSVEFKEEEPHIEEVEGIVASYIEEVEGIVASDQPDCFYVPDSVLATMNDVPCLHIPDPQSQQEAKELSDKQKRPAWQDEEFDTSIGARLQQKQKEIKSAVPDEKKEKPADQKRQYISVDAHCPKCGKEERRSALRGRKMIRCTRCGMDLHLRKAGATWDDKNEDGFDRIADSIYVQRYPKP